MEIREAISADGPAQVRFLMENPMSVEKHFVMDRSPDFNALLRLRGDHRSFCAYSDGRLAGMVTTLWDDRIDQGGLVRVGEITDLRVAKHHRGSWAVQLLLDAAMESLGSADVQWGFCLIGDSNEAARSLVRGRAGLVKMQPLTDHLSLHYAPLRLQLSGTKDDFHVRAADSTERDAGHLDTGFASIAATLRMSPAHPPPWPDPSGRHKAWLAVGMRGQIVGGLVVWDGYDVRRIRVMRYTGADRWLKRMLEVASRLHLATALPPPGGAIRLWASCALWAQGDRPEVVRALVASALRAAVDQGVHVLQLNLPRGDRLIERLPRYPHSSFWSTLYGAKRGGEPVGEGVGPFYAELAKV